MLYNVGEVMHKIILCGIFHHTSIYNFSGTDRVSVLELFYFLKNKIRKIKEKGDCIMRVIKKDGQEVAFDRLKIKGAVMKSADRVLEELSESDFTCIYEYVESNIGKDGVADIRTIHRLVEKALELVNQRVAKSYKDYRDYKIDFVHMLDDVYKKCQSIMYIGDKENSNADSALVSTKRSLIFNELNKALYLKFFLNTQEIQACNDGYLYIHDMSARRDTLNCCLFDVGNLLKGGFEMGNIWYNEPSTLDKAFDVIGDIVLSAASNQYGGFTVPSIDQILAPYAQKSYTKYLDKYKTLGLSDVLAQDTAYADVKREFEDGFQGLEYKFNTVASSRGDYPFTTITFGTDSSRFGVMASESALVVRERGQGKKGFKKPVLFPKLVFLYDENLHGEGKPLEFLFEVGISCSKKTMYPDWLSLTGDGYVPQMYKQYGEIVSPMGCRAFLSPWYVKGGMKPLDETDRPVFTGRANLGAISLHLPMIYAKSLQENKPFYEVLDYYLEMIRKLHCKTYDYLGEMKASTNPLAYCEGGFLGGTLKSNEKIRPLLQSFTMSFGITALNELQYLHNGKSLVEDSKFSVETMEYINQKIAEFKEQDGKLYAVYGTPAESLVGLQVTQFRAKYGIIKNVSDREYVSNSFHCSVREEITSIEKQDLEYPFWNLLNGGKIQYVKYPISYNTGALKTLIRRAMNLGLYEGVNLSLSFCDDCGYEELSMEVCPKCGSQNLTKIDRMNGYLSYSRVKGDTRLNESKMAEIKDRVSM